MSFKFEDLVKISHLIHQKIYLNQHEYTVNNALSIVQRENHNCKKFLLNQFTNRHINNVKAKFYTT